MNPRPQDREDSRPFFGRIESVRALGAMAVAGYHFTGCAVHGRLLLQPDFWPDPTPTQYAAGRLGQALFPGHAMLMAFFVISGLVLRVGLAHGPTAVGAATARFVLHRAFRIYPITAVGVLLSAALFAGPDLTAGRLAANLLLIDASLNPTYWALQVELLVIPFILALFFLERRWGPAVLVAAAVPTTVLVFVPRWLVVPGLSTNLFAFVVGMALPTYGRQFVTGLSQRAVARWVAGAAVVLLAAGPLLGFFSRFSTILEAYAVAVIVAAAAYRSDVSLLRWLDWSWLRRVGMASGSYYVLHMASVPLATAAATAVVPAGWLVRAPAVVGVGVIAVWLVALAPLMCVASRLIEVPGIAAGRRACRALGLERPTAPPAVIIPGPGLLDRPARPVDDISAPRRAA